MREYLATGHILDLVLALVALEIVVLVALQFSGRRRLIAPDVLAHLCSAAGLLTAAHMVLARTGWASVGFCLGCALLAHLLALRLRLRAAGAYRPLLRPRPASPRA